MKTMNMSEPCSRRRVGMLINDEQGNVFTYAHPNGISPISTHPSTEPTWEGEARDIFYRWTGTHTLKMHLASASAVREMCQGKPSCHYWTVFSATISRIKPQLPVTALYRHVWTNHQQRQALLRRTIAYAHGWITSQEWAAQPGFDPVWALLLSQPAMDFRYRVTMNHADTAAVAALASPLPQPGLS